MSRKFNPGFREPLDPSPISDDKVATIVEAIARDGYARIEGYFAEADVAEARSQAVEVIGRSNGEYASIGGSNGLSGQILSRHFSSNAAVSLCDSICRRQGYDLPSDVGHMQVLRCLIGESGSRHSYYFHFDSYVLTILTPIEIPLNGDTGDLLMFPNLRKDRNSYLLNAIEKFVYELRMVQRFIKFFAVNMDRAVRLKMEPGNIYIFNGARSLHANARCDQDRLRATLLFHYGETHRHNWVKRKVRARSHMS